MYSFKTHAVLKAILLVFAIALPSSAFTQVETVTLNGDFIDRQLLTTAQQHIRKESDYCVKENPDWVREFVVMLILTRSEARQIMTDESLRLDDYLWDSYRYHPQLSDEGPTNGFAFMMYRVREFYSKLLYDLSLIHI